MCKVTTFLLLNNVNLRFLSEIKEGCQVFYIKGLDVNVNFFLTSDKTPLRTMTRHIFTGNLNLEWSRNYMNYFLILNKYCNRWQTRFALKNRFSLHFLSWKQIRVSMFTTQIWWSQWKLYRGCKIYSRWEGLRESIGLACWFKPHCELYWA